jgi:hypothetical protein
MGRQYGQIGPEQQAFIEGQRLFFVATAAPAARINLSPKGLDSLRILGPNRVAWLNLTGSGNETAAHLREDDRMTLMFCALEGDPLVLRLYGRARAVHPRDPEWGALGGLFPQQAGARQVIDMQVELVTTACGYGVPRYEYRGERSELPRWIDKKGEQGIARYWEEKNRLSLDGRPTGLFGDGENE